MNHALDVHGGARLRGSVRVDGSKNAVLPLLAAAAVIDAPVTLNGVPACTDADAMAALLRRAGWEVSRSGGDPSSHDRAGDQAQVRLGAFQTRGGHPNLAEASAIRASYYLVAPLIAAYGHAELPWPGGCRIGERGMDLHFAVYEAFGDRVHTGSAGYTVHATSGGQARGTTVVRLPFRSRGATVAALLRAIVAGRPVQVANPNLSAELHSIYRALSAAGSSVEIGADHVSLWPATPGGEVYWRVPGDKIEAGTLACAIAATRGHGEVLGVRSEDVAPLVQALTMLGVPAICHAAIGDEEGRLAVTGDWEPSGACVRAFASLEPGGLDADWEPGLMALALGLPGDHAFGDAINPGRHSNLIGQLRRMGAAITETTATECALTGPQALTGASVEATDIRTGSALLIAALTAKGTTTVTGLPQLQRGHPDLPSKFTALGADLHRRGTA